MNVLLISPLPPPSGGIATWTRLYINSKVAQSNYVKVINTAICGNRAKNLARMKFRDEIKRAWHIYRETRNALRNERFDVAHINTSCSRNGMLRDILCAKLVKRYRIKLVLQCHCDTSIKVKRKTDRFIFRNLCKLSDTILCLNKASENHIREVTGRSSIIIPNFIDICRQTGNKSKYISDSIRAIVYAGHITIEKGCDDIIKAAEKLPHITFKLMGYISDDIRKIPAPNNVKFIGEVRKEEVIKEMYKADLLLFPSHTEGFPNVVLEAMACGLPVIATPVGAIPDMIEDKGGVLVDIGDVDGIVAAISSLEDANLRKNMSEWNINKVLESYTTEVVLDKLFSIYQDEV